MPDPHFVPSALASTLGLAIHSDNPVSELIAYLRDKQMLVVLDSCEHVIEAAASLKSPPSSFGLTAAEVLTFPAVQLFVERAGASPDGFELSDADALVVAEICRKLEGIALAIELASTRVDAFGVRELLALLDDRFRLLKHGRRTALPRHQTLTAALDWSYEFLPEDQRALLRRLSVFSSVFTLDSAGAVAAAAKTDVIEGMANLVAKSLVGRSDDAPNAPGGGPFTEDLTPCPSTHGKRRSSANSRWTCGPALVGVHSAGTCSRGHGPLALMVSADEVPFCFAGFDAPRHYGGLSSSPA